MAHAFCCLRCVALPGLTGATSTAATGPATLRLSLKASPSNEHAAVAVADPTRALALPLAVEPSQAPTSLQLIFDGQPLPTKEVQGEDGVTTVAVLEGVPAGTPSEALGGGRLGLHSKVQLRGLAAAGHAPHIWHLQRQSCHLKRWPTSIFPACSPTGLPGCFCLRAALQSAASAWCCWTAAAPRLHSKCQAGSRCRSVAAAKPAPGPATRLSCRPA